VGFSKAEIHPAILDIGLKFAEGRIIGGNSRCVAMLTALQQVITEYNCPQDQVRSYHNSLIFYPST